jgi:hypothetical protein
MQASHQWATRPDDQRFVSLTDLNTFTHDARERSRGRVVSSRKIEARPVEGDNRALILTGPNGDPVTPTNWAFGQLASRIGAPAAYLRGLPGPLAADNINYGLFKRDVEDLGVLLYKNDGMNELRAVTGPNYGRVWNAVITQALVDRFGDGVTGQWRVPGEFRKRVVVTKSNTTLYASDRDFFIFLADEDRPIEIENRRHGQYGALARGFFVWNSEVGDTSLGISTFLYDYTCSNRMVWGAQNVETVRIRHTKSAPDRFIEEVRPAIEAYAKSSDDGIKLVIAAAQKARVDNVDEFLSKRFSRSQVGAIKAAHLADEDRPIETLWDAATGITAYARGISFQNDRVNFEREAGKVLALAA